MFDQGLNLKKNPVYNLLNLLSCELWCVWRQGCKITLNHSLGMNMKGSDFVMVTCTWLLFVLPFHLCKWACYHFIIDLLFRRGSWFGHSSYLWQKPGQPLELYHANRPNYRCIILPQVFLPIHVAQKNQSGLKTDAFSLEKNNSFFNDITSILTPTRSITKNIVPFFFFVAPQARIRIITMVLSLIAPSMICTSQKKTYLR